jgi:hypothetical protein
MPRCTTTSKPKWKKTWPSPPTHLQRHPEDRLNSQLIWKATKGSFGFQITEIAFVAMVIATLVSAWMPVASSVLVSVVVPSRLPPIPLFNQLLLQCLLLRYPTVQVEEVEEDAEGGAVGVEEVGDVDVSHANSFFRKGDADSVTVAPLVINKCEESPSYSISCFHAVERAEMGDNVLPGSPRVLFLCDVG